MEYGTKSSAEKPSSELEKRIAVSVRKDFCEASLPGSLSFSGAGGSELSGPNALRGEEVADMKVEARTARVIPPPLYFNLEHARAFPGFLARVFLLVVVLAAGVSYFPSDASAQDRGDYLQARGGAGFYNNVLGTWGTYRARPGRQAFRMACEVLEGYQLYTFYACPWNAKPTSKAAADNVSGCSFIASGIRGRDWSRDFDLTQAMVDNGGFYAVMYRPFSFLTDIAFWVPLHGLDVSPSGGLSLVEGGSGTYEVKLMSWPLRWRWSPHYDTQLTKTDEAVTIRVASNNPSVVVKEGGELRFEANDDNDRIWSTAQTVRVEALSDDNLLDERATLSFEVSSDSLSEYSWIAGDDRWNVKANVMDDDYPGLAITGATASESDEALDFTVKLSTTSSRRVTVDWTVIAEGADAGTATPGTADSGDYDYWSTVGGTLVFSEGSPLTRVISVPINDDSVLEGDETVKVSLGTPSPGDVRVSGSGVATGTIVDDDERTVVGAASGEFSQGETRVTVDSRLPEDTGLEVVLPTELERGGEAIGGLVVTLREADADVEIDDDLFGYTGDDADHVLVDVDVSPVPDAAVRICLPVTEELRMAAGERRLYLIRFSGGTWERLSSTVEGEMVCASTSGFSPFAVVYERMSSGSDGRTPSSPNEMNSGTGSGGGGCAISGENRFSSPVLLAMLLGMLLMPLLFFGRFRKRGRRFPPEKQVVPPR